MDGWDQILVLHSLITSSGSLVGLVATKSHACSCREVLVRTEFKSSWGQISVAVSVANLAMLYLWLTCRGIKWTDITYHLLGMQQRTKCYRLGNDCIQFKQPHKPRVAGLHCREWQYNKRNFTYMHFWILQLGLLWGMYTIYTSKQ